MRTRRLVGMAMALTLSLCLNVPAWAESADTLADPEDVQVEAQLDSEDDEQPTELPAADNPTNCEGDEGQGDLVAGDGEQGAASEEGESLDGQSEGEATTDGSSLDESTAVEEPENEGELASLEGDSAESVTDDDSVTDVDASKAASASADEKNSQPKEEVELTASASTKKITKKGWNQSADGTWYWSADGKKPVTGWREISGVWYYFDASTGAMKCNEAFTVGGKVYVATASGACPANRWVRAAGKWYLTNGSCAARTGWVQSGGAWYYLTPKTGVMKANEAFKSSGKVYVASSSGACPANRWITVGGKWYLTDGSCAARTGWVKSGGAWYYLTPKTGVMKANEAFKAGGEIYVATASGACPAGRWVNLNQKWYYTDLTCAARTGWVTSRGRTYYLDPKTGVMKCDESFTVDGQTYVADESGACASSKWVEGSDGWYYVDDRGAALKGWQQISGTWYFFDRTSGRMMQEELFTDEGKTYIARPDGSCPDNAWVTLDGSWYRTNASCAVRMGWWDTGVTVYYFNPKKQGASATGTTTIDKQKYFFFAPMGGLARYTYVTLEDGTRAYINGSGHIATSGPVYGGSATSGWSRFDGDWYYIDPTTGVPATGWIDYKGKKYWLDQEGVMVTGTKFIDGKGYWFDTEGALIKELNGTSNGLIRAAKKDLGYDVNTDPLTGSKFGRWYDENANPWRGSVDYGADGIEYCVIAVSYWLYQANLGAPDFPRAGCEGAALYARTESRVVSPQELDKGMLVLFDWDKDGEPDHIGIVEKRVNDRTIKTVEGNTNGGKVAQCTRSIDTIYCGIRPYNM